jgi:hypothetical protein
MPLLSEKAVASQTSKDTANDLERQVRLNLL